MRLGGWRFVGAVGVLALGLAAVSSALSFSARNTTLAEASTSTSPAPAGDDVPSGHETGGLRLAAASGESVVRGARCPIFTPVRSYHVVAIRVDITIDRYLDHDPQGRMYVLEDDLPRVRQEEAQNARARAGQAEPAVSLGQQGDAIQPLTIRVNQGECLRIALRNEMGDEPASLHLHGSSLHLADSGAPAIATNPKAIAQPGQTVTYEWMVAQDEPEGTHYFHSHGDDRNQTSHGLFGAVIVEPKGSIHLDPFSGAKLRSGWAAMIQDPSGSDFREFALYYHEIGNESYQLLDKKGAFVPQVDPITSAYRPGARALNYRSEPFMNRLQLQQSVAGQVDESVSYSSYVFGDPATPTMRSYLGDPVKERAIHGGSEVFHVHHVHGGSIRWRRQPGVEPSGFDQGLEKHPALLPQASDRTDSQSIGPSETFDIENECGSGGCQQSVGDFLYHCHVAHHYFAGMWGLWRVYNTLQEGHSSTDGLPPLQELPDRVGGVQSAVTSQDLAGKTVDWSGKTFTIAKEELAAWVERQLPPQGVQKGYDASVLDWSKKGDLYLNEPETEQAWPGYRSSAPGNRPPFTFDPKTGKLAYPFLRPHLAKRPPFAPNHGPAPYLDPIAAGTGPPPPGANGPASVCPKGTQTKNFTVHAIGLPIALNKKDNIVDPAGELFVLKEQEDAVRSDNALRTPLAIRANAGEDCVDILLKSELQDTPDNHSFSKVNLHIHFVQFDVQASDGVIAGFNYEQSVRPFAIEGERVAAATASGDTFVEVGDANRFQPGILVGVGMDQEQTFEVMKIKDVRGNVLVFDEPLKYAHANGETVSTEFVRYRWYPDVQVGAAYFHDHVAALSSWQHGLYGALIVEPPGSTYHDPQTGAQLRSGLICDIRTPSRVSPDVVGSFRELVLFVQDSSPLTHVGRSSGSSFNLRAEPLDERGGEPARLFSSEAHGDPETPVLKAFVGDPVVIRALVGATNDVHTLHVDGHWFRAEPYSTTSPPVNTIHLGISERYDLMIAKAGGPQGLPGDYLFYNGRTFKLREGSWGILRVLDGSKAANLQGLPGHESAPAPPPLVCPSGAPQKRFAVAALEVPLPMLGGARGKVYALQEGRAALLSGVKPPEPLVLHVNVGDCVVAELSNETSGGPVSFHTDMLAFDPRDSGGVEAGFDPPQLVMPGQSRTYTFYAHPEVGETVALVRDWGDVLRNPGQGLYGAIVVGPRGATYRDPGTGENVSLKAGWQTVVVPPRGDPYRDFTLFFQDEDETIGTHRMPYTTKVQGAVGLNYQFESLYNRLEREPDAASVFRSDVHGDPATPLIRAYAGDPMKIHVVAPWSEQAQVFSIENHRWPTELGRVGTTMVSSVQVGGLEAVTVVPNGGAGGPERLAGDYLYGDHREPYREAGLWGIVRVFPAGFSGDTELLPLQGIQEPGPSVLILSLVMASVAVAMLGGLLSAILIRRRRG